MKGKNRIFLAAGALSLALMIVFGALAAQTGRASEDEPILQYPEFAPTPTVPAKPGDNAPAGSRAYGDRFDAQSLDNYEIVDTTDDPFGSKAVWDVREGALFQDRTSPIGDPSERETLAIVRASSGSDYTISAKIYDEGNAAFGLVARRQGDSYYRFSMIGDEYQATPKIRLDKVVGETVTPLAEVDGPGYAFREWYTVELSVNGSTIEARVNGEAVLSATDSELTSGQAGLYTRAFGNIRFDDVVITNAQ